MIILAMVLLKQERGKRKKKYCNCGNSVAKIEKIKKKKKGNSDNGFVEIGERREKNNDMLKRLQPYTYLLKTLTCQMNYETLDNETSA